MSVFIGILAVAFGNFHVPELTYATGLENHLPIFGPHR